MNKRITLKDCTKENFEQSWKELNQAIEDYHAKDSELMTKWRESGYSDDVYKQSEKILREYNKKIEEKRRRVIPFVGLKCTIKLYSDLEPVVITRVITPNKVEVTHLQYQIIRDMNKIEYKILDTFNERLGTEVFTKRANGIWATAGVPMSQYPCRLWINTCEAYFDEGF